MKAAGGSDDRRVRRRIAGAFIALGVLAMLGAGVLVHGALVRIPRLERQAEAARAVQFHASSIARHLNFILAEAPNGVLADSEELERRLDLIDADLSALAARGIPIAPLEPVLSAAERLARERSGAASAQLRDIRLRLDDVIAGAGEEARLASLAAEQAALGVILGTAVAGLVYVLLLVGAGYYVLRIVRRQQRAIADQLQALEDKNEDLEAFTGRVAHDLRGPLAPLSVVADVLDRRADDPAAVRDLAVRIRRASDGAQRLIGSLLAFSTTDRAASSPEAGAPVDRCVSSAIADQQHLMDEQGIEVETTLVPVSARIDPSLLGTVLYNLISNAVRYMPQQGRRRIEVRSWVEGARVITEVEDSGAGIAAPARDTIFDPFVRASTLPGGVGLGLATVKRIVEAHRGTVGFGDGSLGGACVRFDLPLAAGAEQGDDRDEPAPSPRVRPHA